jgi:hypothetical protein
VHMMAASDMDTVVNENDRNESEEKPTQISGFYGSIICWLLRIMICFSPRHLENPHTCLPRVRKCFPMEHLLSILSSLMEFYDVGNLFQQSFCI